MPARSWTEWRFCAHGRNPCRACPPVVRCGPGTTLCPSGIWPRRGRACPPLTNSARALAFFLDVFPTAFPQPTRDTRSKSTGYSYGAQTSFPVIQRTDQWPPTLASFLCRRKASLYRPTNPARKPPRDLVFFCSCDDHCHTLVGCLPRSHLCADWLPLPTISPTGSPTGSPRPSHSRLPPPWSSSVVCFVLPDAANPACLKGVRCDFLPFARGGLPSSLLLIAAVHPACHGRTRTASKTCEDAAEDKGQGQNTEAREAHKDQKGTETQKGEGHEKRRKQKDGRPAK